MVSDSELPHCFLFGSQNSDIDSSPNPLKSFPKIQPALTILPCKNPGLLLLSPCLCLPASMLVSLRIINFVDGSITAPLKTAIAQSTVYIDSAQ
ncbi:hypothetical protein A2U01_0030002, partial [Trifolium medium]|nr:hypothetical protein [Trifolium medium]